MRKKRDHISTQKVGQLLTNLTKLGLIETAMIISNFQLVYIVGGNYFDLNIKII